MWGTEEGVSQFWGTSARGGSGRIRLRGQLHSFLKFQKILKIKNNNIFLVKNNGEGRVPAQSRARNPDWWRTGLGVGFQTVLGEHTTP